MSVELLAIVGKTIYRAPIVLVRCTLCGIKYRRIGRPYELKRAKGCASCGQKRRFGKS